MYRPVDDPGLERELRRLLARARPPAGFRARVMRRIRDEGEDRAPRKFGLWWLQLALLRRGALALAVCACCVLLLAVLAIPDPSDHRASEDRAATVAERELAEVLQLAGSQWVRAQNVAFGPDEEISDD